MNRMYLNGRCSTIAVCGGNLSSIRKVRYEPQKLMCSVVNFVGSLVRFLNFVVVPTFFFLTTARRTRLVLPLHHFHKKNSLMEHLALQLSVLAFVDQVYAYLSRNGSCAHSQNLAPSQF